MFVELKEVVCVCMCALEEEERLEIRVERCRMEPWEDMGWSLDYRWKGYSLMVVGREVGDISDLMHLMEGRGSINT